MANSDHVARLWRGREPWNAWRAESEEVPDLSATDLSGSFLAAFDFSNAVLERCRFTNAFVVAADFTGAVLRSADFTGARLKNAVFRSAVVTNVIFDEADLERCDFSHAQLRGSTFIRSRAFDARFQHVDLRESRFEYAELDRSIISNAKLDNVNLAHARLDNVAILSVTLDGIQGLDTVRFLRPATVDISTLMRSRTADKNFLRNAGVPEELLHFSHPSMVAPRHFYSCFISYSSVDEEFARKLHDDLQQRGVRAWYAPKDLKIGSRIRRAIDESIHIHDKLLLVLSLASVGSQWVEQEVETALRREREEERDILFPIRLDDLILQRRDGWPALLRNTRHIGDFTGWRTPSLYDEALQRLLRDLERREVDTGPSSP